MLAKRTMCGRKGYHSWLTYGVGDEVQEIVRYIGVNIK